MGVVKRVLSSLMAASMLVSLSSGLALASSPDQPGGEAPRVPLAERVSTEKNYEMVSNEDTAGSGGVRQYMVELEGPSGVELYVEARERGLQKQDLARAGREALSGIERAQSDVLRAIRSLKTPAKVEVLYQVKNVLNGIAVRTDEAGAELIRQIPGVKSVTVMELHERSHTNSVPLIGGPKVWESFGVLGEGIKVAVIDTGIDYLHTNFGGPGTPEAYELDTTTLNEYFPNAKVAGGWDFAGDAYNGSNQPRPDPNPLDCRYELGGGHGTHVAGTIAGYGVNADGTTYRGPYDRSIPLDSMRIGPGVAPLAELYALRVFGCTGSTGLTVAALDWIVDPNGDGDYSDRMDVANLSLGSAFGGPDDPSSRAANNAALAGVLLAISAGNSGDVYYISGSPGSAVRAVTVAAQVDALDVVDGFRIESPASIAGLYGGSVGQSYNWGAMEEPVTAPVTYDPDNPAGCSAWPEGALAGQIVLVDWVPDGHETFPCGSAVRANNATAAGAVGIIMAENVPFLTTAIAGNAAIPSILTTSTAGEAIKSELGSGVVATLSNEWLNSGRVYAPEREDTLASFSSRGPTKGNGLKPDIAAPGYSIFSARSGSGSEGVSFNGTSMAAPHMAGVLALLRDKNRDWSVEEIKAAAMNTAGHDIYQDLGPSGDRYGQSRVGAGRVDAAAAVAQEVVAYSADDPGAVSVSFGAVEVVGTATFERTVRVVNHGDRTVTYRPSVDMFVEIPGLAYSFPDGNVTVPARGSATFRVRLTADAAQMRATHDPTISETQNSYPRQWIPEHSGVILLKPVNDVAGARATLRVPVYVTARPAADVNTAEQSLTFTGDEGESTLTLTGTGLNTGGFSRYDYNALVTPFELQHVGTVQSLDKASGIGPSAVTAVLQYAGVTTDARAIAAEGRQLSESDLYFGIVAHADWSTPANEVTYEVQVRPEGSTQTYYLRNSRNAVQSGGSTTYYDVMLACVTAGCFLNTNGVDPLLQSGVFNNNVMILPARVTWLGLDDTRTRFQWRVRATHYRFGLIDETPWYTYDYANPGLDFTDGAEGQPTYFADPGRGIPVAFNRAAYEANGSKGVLLLHNLNARGNRAQVVGINAAPADTGFVDPPESKTYGDEPFTV
uniref:S8 family serine peptidase n=1 Tax=Symbiobacterium terraclitae TaxID=557451 RepID=UPI0035B551F9